MVARSRVVLTATIVLAALLVGVTVPAVVPSVAATNSTSVRINPNGNLVLSLTKSNEILTLTVTELNGTVLQCEVILASSPNPTEVGPISFHVVNGTVVYITALVPGSCHPANG
jgi:hypothetical protein